jgi:hypothetical protein
MDPRRQEADMSGMYEDPETQGTDPIDAELGADGQGDLAPEDLPQGGAVEGGSVRLEDEMLADPLDEVGATSPDVGGSLAPGPDDVIYNGSNVDTLPRRVDDFPAGIAPDELDAPGATGQSSLDTDATPSGTGDAGSGMASMVPSADARAHESAGDPQQHTETVAGGGSGSTHSDAAESADGVLEDGGSDRLRGSEDGSGGAGDESYSGGPYGVVPPGREGADSGAVDSVGVEGTADVDVERSSQNDIAGVAPGSPRDAGDVSTGGEREVDPRAYEPSDSNAAAEPGADPQAVQDAPTQHGTADRDIAGVPDAVGAGGNGEQTGTRQDLNDVSIAERVQGIVVQMQGDLGTDSLAEAEVQDVLERRLVDSGITADVEQIEQLARQVVSGSAPTDVGEGEPGASPSL